MISIVANFYNSGRFIPKLMESVAAQTYGDWELVCVDDCSPGNDSEVVERTARQLGITGKVRLIRNKRNLGISRAKKAGIDIACGEYITFIDGDDWLAPDALERLVKPLQEHDLEMVVMNFYRYFTPWHKKEIRANIKEEHWNVPLTKDVFVKHYMMNFFAENRYSVTYWGKAYKTGFVRGIDFDYPEAGDSLAEDFLFSMAVADALGSMMFMDYAGYFWRYGGITTGNRRNADWSNRKYVYKYAKMFPDRKALLDKYGIDDGMVPLVAQLKNVLVWTVSRMARYEVDDCRAGEIKDFISDVLRYPAYDNIVYLRDNGCNYKGENKTVIDALTARDTDAVYAICHENYRRQWKQRLVNRCKHLLIKPFL